MSWQPLLPEFPEAVSDSTLSKLRTLATTLKERLVALDKPPTGRASYFNLRVIGQSLPSDYNKATQRPRYYVHSVDNKTIIDYLLETDVSTASIGELVKYILVFNFFNYHYIRVHASTRLSTAYETGKSTGYNPTTLFEIDAAINKQLNNDHSTYWQTDFTNRYSLGKDMKVSYMPLASFEEKEARSAEALRSSLQRGGYRRKRSSSRKQRRSSRSKKTRRAQ